MAKTLLSVITTEFIKNVIEKLQELTDRYDLIWLESNSIVPFEESDEEINYKSQINLYAEMGEFKYFFDSFYYTQKKLGKRNRIIRLGCTKNNKIIFNVCRTPSESELFEYLFDLHTSLVEYKRFTKEDELSLLVSVLEHSLEKQQQEESENNND